MRKRAVILYSLVCFSFLLLFYKIVLINNGALKDTSKSQQTKTISIASKRGTIYDRNLNPITDKSTRLIAAVTPSAMLLQEDDISEQIKNLKEKIEKGHPFLAEVKTPINNELVRTFSVSDRYDGTFCCHLTGYLDASLSSGLTGIEKAYDSFLSESKGSLSVSFGVDAYGRALPGLPKYINDNGYSSKAGVILTIDSNIQKICEKALAESKIKSGCALVMHIDTGEIYALASVPTFDRNNVSESLGKENSPLVNKALQSYSVGSAFKAVIAAAALESGISSEETFECKGHIKIGDTVFKCYNETAHGKLDMSGALENSCNTYFINLIEKLDSQSLLSLCRKLGFSFENGLCLNYYSQKGILPTEKDLSLPGEKANFAFGQGKFTATPIQLLGAYHALSTGYYVTPSLFYGYANEKGLVKPGNKNTGIKIFSENTVLKIREMLSNTVNKGNAYNAKSSFLNLAGKTSTAQSGIYENGKEICRTWFAGFFPANNPHYVVIVLNENGISGNNECAGVFRQICENIALSQ